MTFQAYRGLTLEQSYGKVKSAKLFSILANIQTGVGLSLAHKQGSLVKIYLMYIC